jgi:ribonucleoside-diphosphate reductase alpha chain
MSIAPTKSSSYILGQVSPSIEPYKSNYYIKDLAKIKEPFRNPYLKALLKEKKKNTDEVWDSILAKDGSVQHLSFLSEEEKSIFKTFKEISQLSVIQQAAQRQKFIDQGQSVNLMIHPDTPLKDINYLYLQAEELGLKSLYYQINLSAAQEFNRNILDCTSCEA